MERLYARHGDKLRYLIAGVFNTAVAYGLFLAMLALVRELLDVLRAASVPVPSLLSGNYFLIAQWAAWVLSVPVGAMTLKYYAFRSKGNLLHEIFKAYFVYLPSLGVNSIVLWLAVRVLGLSPAIGQLIAVALATGFSYLGHRHFTFRDRTGMPSR